MEFKTITKTDITSEDITTTADCVVLLNESIGQGKWKRQTKFNLPGGFEEEPVEVRVFTDGVHTVSIVPTVYYTTIFNLDLCSLRPVFNAIQEKAKHYHTVDYGDIYLNPFTMSLWIVGGDGGYGYHPMSPTAVVKALNNETIDLDGEVPGFEKFIPEITSTTFEAECYPYDEGSNQENTWIKVGAINDLCNYGL